MESFKFLTNNIKQTDCDDIFYVEGWESAGSGYPLHSNPYLPDTIERINWWNGWNDFVDNH